MSAEPGKAESDVTTILLDMQKEIRHLLGEMEEILALPSVCYDLYPRLAQAWRLYEYGKERTFGVEPSTHLFDSLDSVPQKNEQTESTTWRSQFATAGVVIDRILTDDSEFLARLRDTLAESERVRLGNLFKQNISDPPASLILRAEGNAS